jgi:hypothetical protein
MYSNAFTLNQGYVDYYMLYLIQLGVPHHLPSSSGFPLWYSLLALICSRFFLEAYPVCVKPDYKYLDNLHFSHLCDGNFSHLPNSSASFLLNTRLSRGFI